MNAQDLELERKANIEYLNTILDTYCSIERKSKKVLTLIIFISVVAIYFTFSHLLGGTWGYICTIVILMIGIYCLYTLRVASKNLPVSDGKLAYQACITMEHLIEIKKGTYCKHGVHIINTSIGKHLDLYNRFIQYYPEYASNALKRLASVAIEQKDINN